MDKDLRSKSEKFEEFYDLVLRIHESRRSSQLSASFIAQQLGVSRGWIYKYFGSSREGWTEAAALAVGKIIAKLGSPLRDARSREDVVAQWKEDMENLLIKLEGRPWLVHTYFRYSGRTDHHLGKVISDLEAAYLAQTSARLERFFGCAPSVARAQALGLAARRMSLALLWLNGTPSLHGIPRGDWIAQMVGIE